MFGKIMSISDELMDRYYILLLGHDRNTTLHPMEAKKQLAASITARYHDESAATNARQTWEARFSNRDTAAGATELALSSLPTDLNVITLVSYAFTEAFNMTKSNGELRKQFITTGAVQLNGTKLSDPMAFVTPATGDILRLSKKQSVKFT